MEQKIEDKKYLDEDFKIKYDSTHVQQRKYVHQCLKILRGFS